jgi:catechol 2,3-dioxygenase-like lactoylglutathione lyase family enzyme
MSLPKTHIHLGVNDAGRSAAFYQALLGAPPAHRAPGVAVFEFDSPPLVLTLKAPDDRVLVTEGRRPRNGRGGRRSGFALLVTEPEHVGDAAVALLRAGMRLRLEDSGLETRDPDGNEWRVRFRPHGKGREVVQTEKEGPR